jgi:hypothetical protein
MDVNAIKRGQDFVDVLNTALSETAVLLAIIGPNWLGATDEKGRRRLDQDDDFVRLEISTALRNNIPVIPVRIEGAPLPTEDQLPADLTSLANRMAAIITHESFAKDMDGLEQDIAGFMRATTAYRARLRNRLRLHRGAVGVLIVCTLVFAIISRHELIAFAERTFTTLIVLKHGRNLPISLLLVNDLRARLRDAQQRLAFQSERYLSSPAPATTGSWVWAASQLVAAAPIMRDDVKTRYLRYVEANFSDGCLCFILDGYPHAIASAWVLLSYSRLGVPQQPKAKDVIDGVLKSQNETGWWSITLDAMPEERNASVYVTSLLTIAMASQIEFQSNEATLQKLSSSVDRAVSWLRLQAPTEGMQWRDYPTNARGINNFLFGAMAITAINYAAPHQLNRALLGRSASDAFTLPDPHLYFASDAHIIRKDGSILIDKYRHVPFPWQTAALIAEYPHMNVWERTRAASLIEGALKVNFESEEYRRQEWMVGELIFVLDNFVTPKL